MVNLKFVKKLVIFFGFAVIPAMILLGAKNSTLIYGVLFSLGLIFVVFLIDIPIFKRYLNPEEEEVYEYET